MLSISAEQFEHVQHLSLKLVGIELSARHQALFASRCRRLKIKDLDALLRASEDGDEPACQQLIELLTTSYTGFFRNPWHFEIATRHSLLAIERRGKARLWSAAAATGEEPYSLAMALLEATQLTNPPVTILATDVNAAVLAVAERGEYGEAALGPIEPGLRTRFFSGSAAADHWQISEDARRLVEFRILNLTLPLWPIEGPFDVVFCRNLLMYLETRHRYAVLQRMAECLALDGLLILDPSEHLGDASHLFGHGEQGVYSRRPGSDSGRSINRILNLETTRGNL